jgi:hypothetical protein
MLSWSLAPTAGPLVFLCWSGEKSKQSGIFHVRPSVMRTQLSNVRCAGVHTRRRVVTHTTHSSTDDDDDSLLLLLPLWLRRFASREFFSRVCRAGRGSVSQNGLVQQSTVFYESFIFYKNPHRALHPPRALLFTTVCGLCVKIPHHFVGAPATDDLRGGDDARAAVEKGGDAPGTEATNRNIHVEALCWCGMEAEESGEVFVGDGRGSSHVIVEGA